MEEIGAIIGQLGGWAEIGSAGVLILVVLMILRGDLIPAKTNAFLIAERDVWKETASKAQSLSAVQAETISTLMETAKTIEKVINALPSHENEG